jgi:hypothetical protein
MKKNGKKRAEKKSVPVPGSLKAQEQGKEEKVPASLQNAEITNEEQIQTMKVKGEEKKVEEEKVESHFCKDCKSYDKSTEREFHRLVGKRDEQGNRGEIIEIRAVCMNPKSTSCHHLVMAEYSKRQCPVWEQGVYEQPAKPVEPEKTKEEPKKEPSKKRSKKDKAKKDEETIKKVEKAFEEGAEEVTLDSNGTVKPTSSGPRVTVEKQSRKRFVIVQKA